MNAPLLASYGRRRGRRLRSGKQQLMDTLLPQLTISLPIDDRRMRELLPRRDAYWLEIGFGGGEHLAHQATLHNDTGFIGCEPYINGVGDLLKAIDARQLVNIRLYPGDARELLPHLPDGFFSKAFILFPDPWPKARHHKRRLIQREFLDLLATKMKPGGELLLATDHADYLTWMLEQLLLSPHFEWTARQSADWLEPPADWVETKYQKKAKAEGRGATFLRFVRTAP